MEEILKQVIERMNLEFECRKLRWKEFVMERICADNKDYQVFFDTTCNITAKYALMRKSENRGDGKKAISHSQ